MKNRSNRLEIILGKLAVFILFSTFVWVPFLYAQTAVSPNPAGIIVVPAGRSDLLTKAIKNIKSGGTIQLAGGTYKGNFTVNTPMTITSKNVSETAIISSDHQGTNLTISSSNVHVSHLKFINSGTNISNEDSCIYIKPKAADVVVDHNDFDQCEFSIWVNASPRAMILYNKIRGTMQRIVSNRGNGIYLFYTKNSVIDHNQISGGRDGIYISNSTKVKIENNKMNRTRFGIHYMYSDDCRVTGNTATHSRIGVALMYSKHLHVLNNTFEYNDTHGVLLRQILYTEINNNYSAHNFDGIFIGGSYFNTITNNQFVQNILGVQITSGSKQNKVYNNDFVDNKLQAKFLNIQSMHWGWKGRGNYWSTYVGWDSHHDGIGDKAYYVTNLANWLVFSYPVLHVVLDSPAMVLLQKIENEFPVVRRAALIDDFPLMKPEAPGQVRKI